MSTITDDALALANEGVRLANKIQVELDEALALLADTDTPQSEWCKQRDAILRKHGRS